MSANTGSTVSSIDAAVDSVMSTETTAKAAVIPAVQFFTPAPKWLILAMILCNEAIWVWTEGASGDTVVDFFCTMPFSIIT